MAEEGEFLQRLPDFILEKTIGFKHIEPNEKPEISFLTARLPTSDIKEIEQQMRKKYNFTSVRATFKKRIRRKGCPRNPGISNTKKRLLGLYSINRKGLKFNDLIPLHLCWTKYMENMLDLNHLHDSGWNGDLNNPAYDEFTQLLWKADYHGAYIKVCRSSCPSLVGIEGILVFETKNTIKLLGRDDETRTIPKPSCEFMIKIGNFCVKFIGKHFMIKPSERVVKKVKSGKYFDI